MLNNLIKQFAPELAQPSILCPLNQQAIIKIQGKDSAKFLQGQLSCDLRDISTQQSGFGAYCNQKGRVLALFHIWQHNEETYYLSLGHALIEQVMATLNKYAIFSKISIINVTDEMHYLGLTGTNPEQLLAEYNLPVPNSVGEKTNKDNVSIIKITEKPAQFELSALKTEKSNLFTKLHQKHKLAAANSWNLLSILRNVPIIEPNTSGQFLPHNINLVEHGFISFNKGCYMGQEIIARMHYLGNIKKHMAAFTVESTTKPEAMMPIYHQDTAAGVVVAVYSLSENNFIVLAVIKDELINCVLSLSQSSTAKIKRLDLA